jgi:hypothetical protein
MDRGKSRLLRARLRVGCFGWSEGFGENLKRSRARSKRKSPRAKLIALSGAGGKVTFYRCARGGSVGDEGLGLAEMGRDERERLTLVVLG